MPNSSSNPRNLPEKGLVVFTWYFRPCLSTRDASFIAELEYFWNKGVLASRSETNNISNA